MPDSSPAPAPPTGKASQTKHITSYSSDVMFSDLEQSDSILPTPPVIAYDFLFNNNLPSPNSYPVVTNITPD